MTVRILNTDALTGLAQLPARSAQCCVTSPPYFLLRDYDIPPTRWPSVSFVPMAGLKPVSVRAMTCCLGMEQEPLAYIGHMVLIFREVARVLRKDGTLWLNLGDGYATSGGAGWQGKHGARSNRTHTQRSLQRGITLVGIKNKDLLGIPWRVAFALQADGWYLRSEIIWDKPTAMPESVRDRPTKSHEHVFLFSRSRKYFYDHAASLEPTTGNAHDRGNGINPKARILREPTGWDKSDSSHRSLLGRYKPKQNESFSAAVRTVVTQRNMRDVWRVRSTPFTDAHFATFPPELVDRCLAAGTKTGDLVLDPFGGAMTTALQAERMGRDSVLIEIKAEYCQMGEARVRADCPLFAQVSVQ